MNLYNKLIIMKLNILVKINKLILNENLGIINLNKLIINILEEGLINLFKIRNLINRNNFEIFINTLLIHFYNPLEIYSKSFHLIIFFTLINY